MNATRIFGRVRFARPARQAKFDAAAQTRRRLLATVHIAKKELALSDDDYRAILLDVTGQFSSGDCDAAQLGAVIERFKSRGWKPSQGGGKAGPGRPADHPTARKARAMWLALYHLGAVDKPSELALEAFARRQLDCARLQWADQGLMYRLIEAEKAIAKRHGWNQDMTGVKPEAQMIVLKRRLAEAILAKLKTAGWVPGDWNVDRAAYEFTGSKITLILATASELDIVARALGEQLRAARATGGGTARESEQ